MTAIDKPRRVVDALRIIAQSTAPERTSNTALRVLFQMREEARPAGGPRYKRIKRQLHAACYGAELRTLHKMAKEKPGDC